MELKSYDAGSRIRKSTIAGEAIAKAISKSILSEDMRVFYVALTRAREKLIVIGTTKSGKAISDIADDWNEPFLPVNYGKTNATLFNYMGIAAVRNTACGNLIALTSTMNTDRMMIENFRTDIIPSNSIEIDDKQRVGAVAEAIRECSMIKSSNDFLWEYKDNENLIPSKTSATRLLSTVDIGNVDIPALSDMPTFENTISEITPTMRGTITHKFLQHIDWNSDDTLSQVNALIARGILPDNAEKIINFNMVDNFLKSDIVSRLRKSQDIYREMPFVVKKKYSDIITDDSNEQDILVQGIIDLCFVEDNEWVIVDYKTNRLSPKQTETDIINHYRLQLEIYSAALSSISGRKVKQIGIYLLTASKMLWL